MDEQGEHQEGWQAHDVRSGVARVYEEAKATNALGFRVVIGWGISVLLLGLLDFVGATTVTPPLWDFGAGTAAAVLGSVAMSRAPGPLLGAASVIVLDLAVLAFQFGSIAERGEVADHVVAGLRIASAPVVLIFVANGWIAALSVLAFRNGFSPGSDWRTRIQPRALRIGIIVVCFLALVVGVLVWMGAIRAGFGQEPEKAEKSQPLAQVILEKAKKEAEIRLAEKPAVPEVIPYPDSALPVDSLEGLDAYARSEAEDAWYFGKQSDEAECLAEGQGRQDRCRDDRCKHWARFFVRACLVRSSKTPNFCRGVPHPTDGTGGAAWAVGHCAGREAEACRELLFAVQGHCHPGKPESASTKPATDTKRAD
jgi:hypothetical protein